MKEVLKKLDILKKTSKSTDKKTLLKEYLEDTSFAKVVKFALDQSLHFKIKELPQPSEEAKNAKGSTVFTLLDKFAKQRGVTNKEKQQLSDIVYFFDEWEGWEVVKRIVNKDLKCGIGAKTINNVVPDFLTIYPYMRYRSEKHLDTCIKYPARVEEKIDSDFINIFVREDEVEFRTRNGNELVPLKEALYADLFDLKDDLNMKEDVVFHGEMIGVDPETNKVLPRQVSSGIISKILQETASEEDHECIDFVLWDVLPEYHFFKGKYNKGLKERTERLFSLIEDYNYKYEDFTLKIPKYREVDSKEEAIEFAQEIMSAGGEGAVVKNLDGIWKDSSSGTKDGVKIKAEKDCDLRVIGFEYGKKGSKYEGCLGKIICASEDEKLEVSVGSGFSDAQRGYAGVNDEGVSIYEESVVEALEDEWVGSIVEVKYNAVIESETKDKKSLFLPRFIAKRADKDVADTLKKIEEG
jgi:ATP-dependent DNA ligase